MLNALIVEDDPSAKEALTVFLGREGFAVQTATSLAAARQHTHENRPDIVLVDLRLEDGSGLELLEHLDADGHRPDFVVITGHASVESAVEALRLGAIDYLTKPVDVVRLKAVLANVTRANAFRGQIDELRDQLRKLGRFGRLVGSSAPMQALYDRIARVAPTDATVLIGGESGTGKELVAETIHKLSRRAAKPLLALNCGAISASLIESELFGHERGSFTGAHRQHQGYFERAEGGTLVLDEIGEMPYELQVKLLRVLEGDSLNRVGGQKGVMVDVRVLALTNRDLDEAAAQQKFRPDLLYRLRVVPITVPPLREREGDIEILAETFLEELNRQNSTTKSLAPSALALFRSYGWPGNVRELKNLVHQLFILSPDVIEAEHLPEAMGAPPRVHRASANGSAVIVEPGTPLADVERRLIHETLKHFAGDKRRTAEALGISAKTLYNRLHAYRAEGN